MKITRLLGAAVGFTTLGVAMLAPSAGAATVAQPEVFTGSAAANGLGLTLDGQAVTLGAGVAKVTSGLTSSANGTAILSVLGSTTSSSQVSGVSGAVTDGPRCNPSINLSVLAINNACTVSTSTISNGVAHAVTRDTVEGINLNINSLLNATPLGSTLANTLQPVVNQLGAAAPQLNPVTSTVGGVLNDVLKTPTSTLTLGDSVSDVITSTGAVTSKATANGGELDILPAPKALNNAVAPLASVIVGSSSVTASYNRLTGKSAASFDPALVTVKLGQTPATPALTLSLKPGVTQTIPLPAGLGSLLIQVADGDTFTRPDGTVGAEANAVKLGLTLLNQPTINLAIAGTTATVAGAPAVVAPVSQATPAVLASDLPHTGGAPWMPLLGGFVLAAFVVVRRLRVATR